MMEIRTAVALAGRGDHLAREIFFFFKNLWLCHTACGILVPLPGIEPVLPVLVAQSLNHWTTGEVLRGNVL